MNDFIKMLKENKKLSYAINVFILLIIISLILKLDFSQFSKEDSVSYQENEVKTESYVYALEKRMEEILGKISDIKSVDVMIYTKKTPVLEPVYDENISNETNIESMSDGTKREVNRETKQNKVILGRDNSVVERFYQYPEISGVLVVVNYNGNKDIYSILMNSVKTLLDIKLNDIEIVVIN
jgi:stage III sporulation protein AG